MFNYPIWSRIFWGNTLESWFWAVVIFLGVLLALKIFKTVIISRLKKLSQKTKTQLDDLFISAIQKITSPFYLIIALYSGSFALTLPPLADKIIYYVFLIGVVYYVIRFLENLINYGVKVLVESKEGQEGMGIIKLGGAILKIALWAGAIVLLLSNMGYNVTSLVAGLGIGGIAVALAVQSILGDLFSSLTIFLDKPFKIGDFIAVGDNFGTVQKVGIKTSRIELLQGEELVIANSDLTNSRIRNFGPMKTRRVVFTLGVVYGTAPETLEKIPETLKNIIEKEEGTEIERIHFKEFGDSALIFEVAFYINSPDYYEYMDTRQKINLEITKKFGKEGIEMAFPTQTIHLKK